MNCPAEITSLTFAGGTKVLLIGPHPDDFDAVGVTLRFFQKSGIGIRVGVAITGSGVEDSYCSPPSLEAKERLREREQRAGCRFFGLPEEALTFLRLDQDEDAQPVDSPANLERLSRFIDSSPPDIIILPHGNDTNVGHRVMYSMVKRAVQQSSRPMTLMLSRDPKTIGMRFDIYTPFGKEEADWKAELLRHHDSQHQRNLSTRGHGFDERILANNRRSAKELGIEAEYAEVFEVEELPRSTPADT